MKKLIVSILLLIAFTIFIGQQDQLSANQTVPEESKIPEQLPLEPVAVTQLENTQINPIELPNMEVVGHVGGISTDIAISGNFAYIGTGLRVKIFDISNSTNPIFITQTEILNNLVLHIQVVDNFAYVVDSSGHLYIFDISNPAIPNKLGYIKLNAPSTSTCPTSEYGHPEQLRVQGNYVYIIIGYCLSIIDTSNPTNPQQIESLRVNNSRMDIAGNSLYLVSYTDSGRPLYLSIFDVTDPTTPNRTVLYELPAGDSSIKDVKFANQTLYYITKTGFYIINVENPNQPVFVGYMALGGGELFIDGGKAYIRAYGYGIFQTGFYVADVSDRTNPYFLAYHKGLSPLGMAFSSQQAFITTASSLHLIDLSNVQEGLIVNQYDLGHFANDIVIDGPIAYISAPDSQLMQTFNVADPNSPVLLSQTSASECEGWTKVDIVGAYAYFHQGLNLCIFDMSNPQNLTYVATHEFPPLKYYNSMEFQIIASEEGIFVVVNEYEPWCGGSFVCGTEHYTSIRHLDMTNPQMPSSSMIYSQDDIAIGQLEFVNDHLFLAINHENYGGHALRILDASNLSNPQERFNGTFPEYTGLKVSGSRLFASTTGLLQIFDIQNTSQPLEIGRYENSNLPGANVIIVKGNDVILTKSFIPYEQSFIAQLDISDMSQIQLKNMSDWYNNHLVSTATANDMAYMLEGSPNPERQDHPAEYGRLVFVDIEHFEPLQQSTLLTSTTSVVGYLVQADDFIYAAGNRKLNIFNTELNYMGGYLFDNMIRHLAIIKEVAYVIEENEELYTLHILDVSNPQAPTIIGDISLGYSSPRDMIVIDDFIYIADDYRLLTIDPHNLADPVLANTSIPFSVEELAFVNGSLYLNDYDELGIMDISNPISPTLAANFDDQYINSMTTNGSLAFLSSYDKYKVWDVTNPISPTIVSETDLFFRDFKNGIIYDHKVTYNVGRYGIDIVDVFDPSAPHYVAFNPMFPPMGKDLAIVDHKLYGAAGSRGLVVYQTPLEEKSMTLPLEGGDVTSDSGDTHLQFPGDSFSETVQLNYLRRHYDRPSGELVGIKHLFEVTAVSAQTNQPINLQPDTHFTIEVQYADRGIIIEETLALYTWDGQQWVHEPNSQLDINGKTITAEVDYLGIWVILGETNRIWQPTILNNACPAPINAEPRAYLRLDEPVGSTQFNDLTCYEHHGTCSGDSCPVAGVDGVAQTAVHFDGQDDAILLDYQNINLGGRRGKITLAAWIKPESVDGTRNIIARGYGEGLFSDTAEVFLRINDGQYQVGAWDGTDHMTSFAIPPEDTNNWVHLAGIYDGTSWRLYRNGNQVSATEASTGAAYVYAGFGLGAHSDGTERFFHGSIDEVYISGHALSTTEIDKMYQANQP